MLTILITWCSRFKISQRPALFTRSCLGWMSSTLVLVAPPYNLDNRNSICMEWARNLNRKRSLPSQAQPTFVFSHPYLLSTITDRLFLVIMVRVERGMYRLCLLIPSDTGSKGR